MQPVVIAIIAAGAGLLVGFFVGRLGGLKEGLSVGRREGLGEGRTAALEEGRSEGLAEGRRLGRSEGLEEGRARGFDEGRTTGLEEGRTYARSKVRDGERQAALVEAVGRVSGFLTNNVKAPLAGAAADADADELRERIDRALGALQDVDFFMTEVDTAPSGTDLAKLAGRVAREFATDQDVVVRFMLSDPVVEAEVNPSALLDALYLLLHNAARFGGGTTIDLIVRSGEGRAEILVRDHGEGFSEEAFARAFDPFYSTTPDGLGLGLPHARRVIEEMGGSISLRNVPDGGAEVEISFPVA